MFFIGILAFLLMLPACTSTRAGDPNLKDYHKLLAQHEKEFCSPGTEAQFEKLFKKYRGYGYWVPELKEEVDFMTIEKLLPEIETKLTWISQQKLALKRLKKLPHPIQLLTPLETRLDELLKLKWYYDQSLMKNSSKSEKVTQEQRVKVAAKGLLLLKKDWSEFLKEIPFLTSYAFPVDHLKNRKIYDEFKDREDLTAKQIANYVFFYRKILEDGAYNKDHTAPDYWLRGMLETVELELQKPMITVTEDLRYDFLAIFQRVRRELERGKSGLLERLEEWEERTQQTLTFYRELIAPENRVQARKLIREKYQATHQLKEWVHERQARSWMWWSKKPEELKALYVLETILYNEVGDVEAGQQLEREDVAQVVINRSHHSFYHRLQPQQDLYKTLKKYGLKEEAIQSQPWLNILYRQGEFSFTYFYMLGAVKAFCPDRSKKGQMLMEQNLKIAQEHLRLMRKDFPALRYFSRASMPARIHMADVWDDFQMYPERPGQLAPQQNLLQDHFAQKRLQYLYRFEDPSGVNYQVWSLSADKIYTLKFLPNVEKPEFYLWRNPHYFTYFVLKPGLPLE